VRSGILLLLVLLIWLVAFGYRMRRQFGRPHTDKSPQLKGAREARPGLHSICRGAASL